MRARVKDQVYRNNPGTLEELKEAVTCALCSPPSATRDMPGRARVGAEPRRSVAGAEGRAFGACGLPPPLSGQ